MLKVKDKDLGYKDIIRQLKSLKNKTIEAGILNNAGTNSETGTLIAEYAHYNEYGTKHIPARPFMSTTFDEQNSNWVKSLDSILEKLINSNNIDIDKSISLVGEQVVNDIKEKITSNIPPTLNLVTIKRKKSSKTLIDTGNMRDSINFKIVNK